MQGKIFKKTLAVALCLLLSLLLHLLFALLLLNMPEKKATNTAGNKVALAIRLHRAEKAGKQEEKPPGEPEQNKPSAKTDPDQAEQRPEQDDFIGKRNARAASDKDARGYEGESTLPSMTGEKKEEIVAFDQQQQQGDLEHDSRHNAPDTPALQPPSVPPQPPTPPRSSGASTPALTPPPASPEGDLNISKQDATGKERENEQKEQQQENTTPRPIPPTHPAPPIPPAPGFYRDPSLANPTQAGFRTRERRSRNAGRFVLGRHASLNVAATPLGRYEEEIYRRIAYWWYRACDEHRGDIIPGKIVVSLRLDKNGRLVNMDLIRRSGAGVIQQAFTFGAIRHASLPPMPHAVQEEMVGNLLELIFEFVFD